MRINLNHLHCHPWEEFGLAKNLIFLIALKKLALVFQAEVTAHVIDGAAIVNIK